ncbi:tetratricopeptide repeat protein [Virgibacillus sp. NKC19-3]|uniref:tetratricopeptide repeat protein n=1 Tax=Virgibacillus saliphilus TaxID=2831674 RepID=UPI001C9AC722|nr:tetratricopeptide repeat protein [Virgibacillus sp. NKC19-3]MBY7142040.1 tetratricopeptide repeat protein [Virgibacillus sp. NKC19-3]
MESQVEDHLTFLGEKIKMYVNRQEYELAREHVAELEAILDSGDNMDTQVQFLSLYRIAEFYHCVHNYDKAVDYHKRALAFNEMDKIHSKLVIDTYLDYAGLEREYGRFSNARKLLTELVALLETMDQQDAYDFGRIYSSLGKVDIGEGDDKSGLNQLEKALGYFRQVVPEANPVIGQTIHTISDIHLRMEAYDQALHLHQSLLETYQQIGDKVNEGKSLLKMGKSTFISMRKRQEKRLPKH